MANEFPTRQVIRRQLASSGMAPLELVSRAMSGDIEAFRAELEVEAASGLHAMVIGFDESRRVMPVDEVAVFGDPFTQEILLKGARPMTLGALADAIDGLAGDQARPLRKLYAIAEGAPFKEAAPAISTNTRLVFTWQKDNSSAADLLLSTVPDPDGPEALLQLIAWSEREGAFHFFERVGGRWFWAGNSFHALSPSSRGKGPFDSHINGALVMKELRSPWLHWHSQSASIPRNLLFPTPALAGHQLFTQLVGAEELETTVITGVRRWTRRRVARDLQGGVLDNLKWYVRQIVWTTSVNIVSSGTLFSQLPQVEDFSLPASFFYDHEAIKFGLEQLDPNGVELPSPEIRVASPLYLEAARQLAVHVESEDGVSIPGDTAFAFAVPERAFEDRAVISALVNAQALSARLALCLLMVDFVNPVFSPKRAILLAYAPQDTPVGNAGAALDSLFVTAIPTAGSVEAEFLAFWNDPDLPNSVRTCLAAYLSAVRKRLKTQEGVTDLLKLADSRREAFRSRKLNEFRHTTARNGATVAKLAMRPDGSIFEKPTAFGEEEM